MLITRAGKPHVCVGDSTAAFELAPPEYWQMGTFAEAGRQRPYLFARLAKAPRHAVGDPMVAYSRRKSKNWTFNMGLKLKGIRREWPSSM